jgi:hypothetical protein
LMTPHCWRLSRGVRLVYYMSLLTKSLILHRIGEWNLIQESAREWLYPSLNDVIHISGLPVERESSFKLLGLLLSDDLSWNCHVDYVIKKANTSLYALRILKKAGLSQSELVNIYCSFIRSRIEYASSAWSSLTRLSIWCY